jgi:hypothetical protein
MRFVILRITLGVIAAFQAGFGILFLVAPGVYPAAVGLAAVPAWAPWIFGLFGARALGFAAGMVFAIRDPNRYRSWIAVMIGVQAIDWIVTMVFVLQGTLTVAQVSTAGFMPIAFIVALALTFPRRAAAPIAVASTAEPAR